MITSLPFAGRLNVKVRRARRSPLSWTIRKIENTVNVPSQPVTLTMKGTTSVVRRDAYGRIAEIESAPADVSNE